jgi:hypothetical protein
VSAIPEANIEASVGCAMTRRACHPFLYFLPSMTSLHRPIAVPLTGVRLSIAVPPRAALAFDPRRNRWQLTATPFPNNVDRIAGSVRLTSCPGGDEDLRHPVPPTRRGTDQAPDATVRHDSMRPEALASFQADTTMPARGRRAFRWWRVALTGLLGGGAGLAVLALADPFGADHGAGARTASSGAPVPGATPVDCLSTGTIAARSSPTNRAAVPALQAGGENGSQAGAQGHASGSASHE